MELLSESEMAVCAGMTGDELVRAARALSKEQLAICEQIGISPNLFVVSRKLGGGVAAWQRMSGPRRSPIIGG